jgi:hypothetical protein
LNNFSSQKVKPCGRTTRLSAGLHNGEEEKNERTHDQATKKNPQPGGQVGGVEKVVSGEVASVTALERK